MWPTPLIGWYAEWSTYFLLKLSSLWMVLMMITDDDYFTNESFSFDGFQPEGPLNIEPIMFWWLTVKPHQGLH